MFLCASVVFPSRRGLVDRGRRICYRFVSSMSRVRLHSLRLVGFKSFPDEVELSFPGDVSAIVGPNGCGKSNLVDAILWVTGEQSPTMLRLKGMTDVVFSGAASRQPGGAAEVALRLTADDGRWEATGGRLEVSRRVLRSGPSEYRIDGRAARLKDVADRLLAIGLGTREYSIIEQGRVGQVLSARPTDRRVLLEEAAGITRYKARRHESELKLEHTRQNLLRLDDVIGEVERALRQLKRQARQAERYSELETELKAALHALHALEAAALDGRRCGLKRQRGEQQNEVAAAAAALGSAEADLAEARAALDGARGEVESARSEVSTHLAATERLTSFLERSADLAESLRTSLATARRERMAGADRAARLEAEVGEANTRLDRLASTGAEVAAKAATARDAEAAVRAELDRIEGEAGRLREDLLKVISAVTASRNRLRDLEREQDRASYAVGQLEQERDRLAGRRGEVEGRFASAGTASREAADRVAALETARRAMVEERGEVVAAVAELKRRGDALGHAVWDLRHRLTGIEREQARLSAAAEEVTQRLPEGAVRGQLSRFLQPEPGLAPVLDRVWRDWLQLPVVDAGVLPAVAAGELSDIEGHLRLAVSGAVEPLPGAPVPDGAESLIERAGLDPAERPWLERVLPPAFRVGDVLRARAISDARPDAVVLGPDGALWRGRTVEPPGEGARLRGALELDEERHQLESELARANAEANACAAEQRRTAESLDGLDAALEVRGRELVAAEQARAGASAAEEAAGGELSRLERELEAVEAELERTRVATRELATRRNELEGEVTRLQARSEQLEQAVEGTGTSVDERRAAAADALRHLDRWRAEERLERERLSAAHGERDRLATEQSALGERLSVLDAEAARLQTELESTETESVRSRTRLVEEQGLLAASRERERRFAEAVQSAAGRVERLDSEVRSRRSRHDAARVQLHEVEMELTRVDADWKRLTEVALADVGVAPEHLLTETGAIPDAPDELARRVEKLRGDIERLGPVNLLALREASELEDRATFLGAQRKDLVGSLKVLEETIRDIDATCTERFVATFEQVNGLFAETFSHLFGGGSARLDLVDEDNPLESGIDITAQPPGKRNQSVQLLSGGEKALTALSLLVALFRIRPSPVCILDEVDAPLDDANVERLMDLVRAMTEHTQFVLITHNRRTMSRADVLYGVTMEEPGVSKVVSVRIEE